MRSSIRDDSGFTLIELLITIIIMGLIIGAISATIIVSLKVTDETQARLAETHDLDLAAAYFGADVQSSQTLGGVCGTPSGASQLITMSWSDPGTDPAATDDISETVTYYVNDTVSPKTLERYSCHGTASPIRDVLIDRLVAGAPALDCLDTSDSPISCTSAPNLIKKVRLAAEVCTKDPSGNCLLPEYAFTLLGTRRLG